jgi:hypothetical protein
MRKYNYKMFYYAIWLEFKYKPLVSGSREQWSLNNRDAGASAELSGAEPDGG